MTHLSRPQAALLALGAWLICMLWLPVGLPMLRGVDAAVYCQVAHEIAERPLHAWATITLDGAPFYEHPPGFMYFLALCFTLFGSSVATALAVAQTLMGALMVLVLATAWCVAGPYAAVGTVVGMSLQSGFWQEAHNPMLELPTNVGLALGAWGLVMGPYSRAGVWRVVAAVAAAAGPALAYVSKGPVAAVSIPVAMVVAALGLCSWRRAVCSLAAGWALLAACVAAFELSRSRAGLDNFTVHYATHQLWPSMVRGRHHSVPTLLFYGPVLWRWYAAGMVSLPLAVTLQCYTARRRKHRSPGPSSALLWLGAVWLMCVVLGFSCMRQKYQWYMHIALPAFALITGAMVASLPRHIQERLCTCITATAAVAAVAFLSLRCWAPTRIAPREPRCLAALHRLPPLRRDVHRRRPTLCCCVGAAGWRERYVALFVQDAELVPCAQGAQYVFDDAGWHEGDI